MPSAQDFALKSLDAIPKYFIPALDVPAILREDSTREAQGMAPRFAIPHAVRVTPARDGAWESVGNDLLVWRLRVVSPGAVSINFGFTRYLMPPGGRLFIYSTDLKEVVRPFTDLDNADHGELWTPPVPGEEVVIELTVPKDVRDQVELTLGSINVGYRPFGISPEAAERSGACNVDVACPEGVPWALEIRSVAVISTGGSTFCTGFMVNNTAYDAKPYFMTANHCGVNSGNAPSLVAFWNYQNSTCRPPGSPASGNPGDGTLTQFNTGSTFRASFSTSDVTLVELTSQPNPAWMVTYAGWDRSGANPPSGACIHHPSTDEKRISFYDATSLHPSHGSSWPCSAFPGPGDNTHITVYWSLGVTEPGSSGSPLFDDNHRVIGQLHGGPSSCSATGENRSDCYGRFSRSWTGGGTNSTRLSNWLDPGSTGLMNVDTIDGPGLTVTPSGNVLHVGNVGGPFTNDTVAYTLTNPTPNTINYSVSLNANFGILLDGGTGPVNGSLPGNGGTVNVVVTLGPPIYALGTGVYVETIDFDDLTNSRSLSRQHTVEVGQTAFTTDPSDGLSSSGPVGGPFPATKVYTLTSTRPTPVDIQISANQPWISINGGAGPVNVNLNGTGASTNVTIGYSAAANSLPNGLHSGTVTFTNLTGGAGGTTRPVSLDVGRYVYNSTDVPKVILDNSSVSSVINVTDAYCIGDVDVPINITHTYIGDLTIDLQSPQGTVVRLHNRSGGTTDNIVATYDDSTFPPSGPGALADFNGEIVTGTWTLTVSDLAGADTGTLNSWSLRIAASGAACPPVAANMNLNVPDTVPTDITLATSSTVGPNFDHIILSLPTNGKLFDPNGGMIASTPYTLMGQQKVVRYKPNSLYFGPDSFTYKANDGQDSVTATVSLTVGSEEVVYDFPLNTNPGWTTQGDWAFGVPTGGGTSGRFDPTSGYTGTNVYGYNLAGHYPNSMPLYHLTTTSMNLTGVISTKLEFRRWLGVESSTYDDATVDVSNNGSTWTNLYSNPASSFSEQAWTLQSYSISGVADNQANVQVRWGMGPTDGSVTYQGWNIDDIRIKGIRPPVPGDIDLDRDFDSNDIGLFVEVLLGLDTNPTHVAAADVDNSGVADGEDIDNYLDAIIP